MIMSKHRAETVLAVLAAAEHLADVAELRSPTKMLTEAIRGYREAVESLSKPDLRPGCGAFGGVAFYEYGPTCGEPCPDDSDMRCMMSAGHIGWHHTGPGVRIGRWPATLSGGVTA